MKQNNYANIKVKTYLKRMAKAYQSMTNPEVWEIPGLYITACHIRLHDYAV